MVNTSFSCKSKNHLKWIQKGWILFFNLGLKKDILANCKYAATYGAEYHDV